MTMPPYTSDLLNAKDTRIAELEAEVEKLLDQNIELAKAFCKKAQTEADLLVRVAELEKHQSGMIADYKRRTTDLSSYSKQKHMEERDIEGALDKILTKAHADLQARKALTKGESDESA